MDERPWDDAVHWRILVRDLIKRYVIMSTVIHHCMTCARVCVCCCHCRGDGDSKTFMNPGIMSVSPDRSCLSFEALINFKLECEGLACVVVPHAGREVCMIHGGMSRNRTTGANRIRRRMDITSIHPQLLALKVDRKSGLGRQISHTILYNGVDSLVAVTGMTSVNVSC